MKNNKTLIDIRRFECHQGYLFLRHRAAVETSSGERVELRFEYF